MPFAKRPVRAGAGFVLRDGMLIAHVALAKLPAGFFADVIANVSAVSSAVVAGH
jgi:hypothetical protein